MTPKIAKPLEKYIAKKKNMKKIKYGSGKHNYMIKAQHEKYETLEMYRR